jgi:hypothetical protein
MSDETADPKAGRTRNASTPNAPTHTTTIASLRRNSRALDRLISGPMGQEIDSDPCADWWLDEPECGRRHPGRCDTWGSCTGMNLGVPEREAAAPAPYAHLNHNGREAAA